MELDVEEDAIALGLEAGCTELLASRLVTDGLCASEIAVMVEATNAHPPTIKILR